MIFTDKASVSNPENIFPIKLDQVLKVLNQTKNLTWLQIKTILPDVNNDYECGPGELMLLGLSTILYAVAPIKDDQIVFLLDKFGPTVRGIGEQLEQAIEADKNKIPLKLLSLIDRNFVLVSDFPKTLDLSKGEVVDINPQTMPLPIESVSYGLTTIYCTLRERLIKLNKAEKNNAFADAGIT